MAKLISYSFMARLISLLCYVGIAALECSGKSFFHGAFAAAAVVLLSPLSFEKPKRSFFLSCVLVSLLTMLQLFAKDSALLVLGGAVFVIIRTALGGKRHFKNLRSLFGHNAPWHYVEDFSRFVWLAVWLLLSAVSLYLTRYEWALIPAGALMTLLYLALLLRARSARTWLLSGKQEESLHKMIRGTVKPIPPEATEEGRKLARIYDRAMTYMEDKKPYLSDSMTINDLAAMIFTNKVSLSKAIAYCSGGNFRQFTNSFRIRYAMELMQKDPRLKVLEVSEMSGFHNTVTFGLAFKLLMNKTPGQFKDELRSKKV